MPTIFDIKRFALHDGPGIRTTVFFKGCPLRCRWCHNPESHNTEPEEYPDLRQVDGKEISITRIYGKKVTHAALMEEILKDKVFYLESGGGVTFSGGEPLMQPGALIELLEAAGSEGLHRAVDTSGYAAPETLLQAAAYTDMFLFDLKLMDPEKHKACTGVDNRLILANADRLLQRGAEVIFRIPVVPGINDTVQEMNDFFSFFRQREGQFREVHLLPYHKTGAHKYRRLEKEYDFGDMETPGDEWMQRLREQIESAGVLVTIGG
ncbi:MAG: glycyl-radical enzyme activating protein [Bacteroidales bacterium]|nr:glycyl-radical enzyme activating protein [Bacteroidales bacterium]MDT8431001.1 glycyl-radical enzyme activating protein [Bacteroidales bacterium]